MSQIVDAMTEFSDEKSETGANPNPPITGINEGFIQGKFDKNKNRHETIMPINFDIAISAQETSGKDGKVGVKVMSFLKADGSISSEAINGSVSRVNFKVPLRLPETGADGPPRVKPINYK